MNDTYYVGAYWGPRQESAEACARRAAQCLQELAAVDALFAHWFKQARSRKEALKRPVELDLPNLSKLFQRKVLRDDRGGAMEDMGFNLGLWNGGSGADDVGLSLTCGAYWENVTNVCLLSLPSAGVPAERVLTARAMTEVLRAIAAAWEPDWGVAMSHAHRELVKPHRAEGTPYVGWVTYLSRSQGTVPPLPAPVRMERVQDKGTLITLTPERFTADNPGHVALAADVRDRLNQSGLLHPPPGNQPA